MDVKEKRNDCNFTSERILQFHGCCKLHCHSVLTKLKSESKARIFFKKYYCILFGIVHTFFIENDAEILPVHYTWKVAFANFIHKQRIQVKL